TDGTSTTLALGECSGRPWVFVANGRQLTSASDPLYISTAAGGLFPSPPVTDRNGVIVWSTVIHGAWAHNDTYNVNTFNSAAHTRSRRQRQPARPAPPRSPAQRSAPPPAPPRGAATPPGPWFPPASLHPARRPNC